MEVRERSFKLARLAGGKQIFPAESVLFLPEEVILSRIAPPASLDRLAAPRSPFFLDAALFQFLSTKGRVYNWRIGQSLAAPCR